MKTPRDILLGRYRYAEAELERVQAQVLGSSLPCREQVSSSWPRAAQPLVIRLVRCAWTELFWRARRVWGGFAVAWVIILILNAVDTRQARIAAAQSATVPAEVLLAWEQGPPLKEPESVTHGRSGVKPLLRPGAQLRRVQSTQG
jgi:hypothetical protein